MAANRPTTRRGWLIELRRLSGVGLVVFAFVLVVGSVRAQALALAAGDDEICSAMAYASGRMPVQPSDPSDLADRHHACCDLGLCLDASALPPSEPPPVSAGCAVGRARTRRTGAVVRRSRRDRANRPRGPPSV